MNGPCRFHSSRRPPVADASTAAETLQIFIVGRHDDRRPAGVVFTEEGLPIALHRAIEIIEFGVLAIARGIDARRFAIGGAADDLRFLLSFGADRDRLLLPRGAHPVISRLTRRTLEIGR